MSTPPKVTRAELTTTVRRIVHRRVNVDDPDRHLLPDDENNPQVRELLDYLQAHTRVPAAVLQADVCDALVLQTWLWWEDRRRELAWLKTGRHRGLFLAQLGGPLGIGKRGVGDRIDRLEALLQFDRPNEKITRDARRAAHHAEDRRELETRWVRTHADELSAIAGGFTTAADRFELADTHREWVDELALTARDNDWTPATMAILSLAVEELRTAPNILALQSSRPYQIHKWLEHADRLRTTFAGLGSHTTPPAHDTKEPS